MRRALLLLFALPVAVLATACGEEALSKSEYIAKADAVCAKYDKKLEALPNPKSIQDIGDLADRAIPIVENGIGELKDLNPPDELKDDVDRWLDLNDRELGAFKKLRDAAKKGDTSKTQSIANGISQTEKRADATARRIGLRKCATTS